MTAPTYKSKSSAKRAGKRLCLKNQWPGYEIYTLDKIYLVTPDNQKAFEAWLTDCEIPVREGECSRHYVYPHIHG